MHRLPLNGNLIYLPLRPIVSNIGSSAHNLVKFLSKLLSPLRQSDHSIRSTKVFIQKIKMENILTGYKMVSFDVKSYLPMFPYTELLILFWNEFMLAMNQES